MTLLSPWLLLGVLTALLPVLIHLIGRRRARRQPFAAIEFLLRSNRKMARRLRLRQILLLVARALLLGALALMMAKPVFETTVAVPEVGGGAQSTVVIIDDSLSMRRRLGSETAFQRARRRARALVSQGGGQARFAVLSVTRPSGPLAALSREQRKLRSAIDGLQPTFQHAKLDGAIARAVSILESAESGPPQIVVISDMAAHGWSAADLGVPAHVGFYPIDVAKNGAPDNRAVVELSTEGSVAPGHRSVAITARVCNYGPRRKVTEVRLSIDGHDKARGALTLDAGRCAAKRFNHTFGAGGVHEVVVSIPPDELPADDVRYLRLTVRADARALLVDGSPSPVRHRDELFYLETALDAPAEGQRRVVSSVVTPDQLEPRRLTGVDVVLLCNVESLEPAQSSALQEFVMQGGGLLISVGDNVKAARYNEFLADLLPQPLRGPVAAQGTAREAALRLGAVDAEHPVLASLSSSQHGGGLRQARFFRAFRLRPATSAARRVLLRFDDGAPALVEAQRGSGRVLLFASTIDRDWTDLPIRPGYAPLFQQLVRYLSGAPLDVQERRAKVGATQVIQIESGTQQLRLEAPAKQERSWSAKELRGRDSVDVVASRPGFYRLSASSGGHFEPLLQQSFVANIEPAESVLKKGKIVARRAHGAEAPRATRQVELWHAVGLFLLLILLGEALLTRRG